MKSIVIAGRVGKDGQARRTQDGTPVLSFPVAVDDGFGQSKATLWFDVSVWGKRGESLASIITKGMAVAVCGDLGMREHNGKNYLTVRANEVTLQGGGSEKPARQSRQQAPASLGDELSDEIPF